MTTHRILLPLLFALLGAGLGVEGSTITKDFNANDVVSFLHGLPHYDLSLHKSDNVFDPKSWSYDQTMIWFVVPGVVVILLTLLLALALAIRKCVRACCLQRVYDEDNFDSFPSPTHRTEAPRQHGRTPKWVRGMHAVTFVLMLAAIGVVTVTWLASYDFFKFVGDSFDPVDDTNKIVENAFNNVDTLLNVSREGLLEVAQLNATFMEIRTDVLVINASVTTFGQALGLLPNLTSFSTALGSWAQRHIIDLPAALPPIYSGLTALNASIVAMPNTAIVEATLLELNATVQLGQLVDISQFSVLLSLLSTVSQLHDPVLNTTRATYTDLRTMEEAIGTQLLPHEKSLVAGVLAGGANPPYSADITALANQIQQKYVSTGDAINALPSVQQLVQKLVQYNTTGSLPADVSAATWQMKADYEQVVPPLDTANLLQLLMLLEHYSPADIEDFLQNSVSPALAQVLDVLVVPAGFEEVYENWQQQTDGLSGEMDSYHTIQDKINDYLPKIENYVDKAELGRFIYFNVTCAWMLLACVLSLVAICKPRLQTWLMVNLWIALFLAGIEMAVYLPPAVFTSDLCSEPDNFTLSLVPSDESDLEAYVSYYVYCNHSQANPLLPYTGEVRAALDQVDPLLATLQNYSSLVTAARPYVLNLTNQLVYSRLEIGHLEQLSNCSTIHPLYNQMKTNVCQHLTPAAFLMFAGRGVLVIVVLVVFLLSIGTLGYQKRESADDSFPMTRTRRVAFDDSADRQPLLRNMTEDYLAIHSDTRQIRRGRDMVASAPSAPPASDLSINF